MRHEKCISIKFFVFIFDTYDSDASDFTVNREVQSEFKIPAW